MKIEDTDPRDLTRDQVNTMCTEIMTHSKALRDYNRNRYQVDYYDLKAMFEELRGNVEALAKYFEIDEEDVSQADLDMQRHLKVDTDHTNRKRRQRRPHTNVVQMRNYHTDAKPVRTEKIAPGHTLTHMDDGSAICECGLVIEKEE